MYKKIKESNSDKKITKKMREDIRSRYKQIVNRYIHVATERGIVLEKLDELDTVVKQYMTPLFDNPVHEEKIGLYRSPDKRKCVTCDMEVLQTIIHNLKRDPPSFLEAGPRKKIFFDPDRELKVGIATAGGIAPGLNTVIHSIVNMHKKVYPIPTKILGFYCGFEGIEERRFTELEATDTIKWIHSGGTELYTVRGKRKEGKEKDELINKIIHSLYGLHIDILYVIGGDGSLTFAHEIAQRTWEMAQEGGQKIVVVGIPKTMDNDILWVWHSFGFDTAVEEATKIINSIYYDIKSGQRIGIIQLFGREAGFVAAHATLASGLVDAVLIPEIEFEIKPLLDYIERKVADKNHALIVIAEGAKPRGISVDLVKDKLRTEGHNPDDETNPIVNARLAQWRLEVIVDAFENHFRNFNDGRHQVSIIQPRYLIRSVSPNSVDQIYCQRLADLAVHNALAGYTDFMISQWLTEYVLVPLGLIANQIDPDTMKRQTKKVPPGGIFWTTVINSTGQPTFKQ